MAVPRKRGKIHKNDAEGKKKVVARSPLAYNRWDYKKKDPYIKEAEAWG